MLLHHLEKALEANSQKQNGPTMQQHNQNRLPRRQATSQPRGDRPGAGGRVQRPRAAQPHRLHRRARAHQRLARRIRVQLRRQPTARQTDSLIHKLYCIMNINWKKILIDPLMGSNMTKNGEILRYIYQLANLLFNILFNTLFVN